MKVVLAFLIVIIIPVIMLLTMITILIPLLAQHFFRQKFADDTAIFPYLTSWEEAA